MVLQTGRKVYPFFEKGIDVIIDKRVRDYQNP